MNSHQLILCGDTIPTKWLEKINVYGRTPKTKSREIHEIEKKKLIKAFNYDMCCIVQMQFLLDGVSDIPLYGDQENIHRFHYMYTEKGMEHNVEKPCKLCEIEKDLPLFEV